MTTISEEFLTFPDLRTDGRKRRGYERFPTQRIET